MAIAELYEFASIERLENYSNISDYVNNLEKSSQIYQMLHWVEIGYRNRIFNGIELVTADRHSCGSWLTCVCVNPPMALNSKAVESLRGAKRLLSAPDDTDPAKIIPELSFGFWIRLLSSGYETHIWNAGLHKVFPQRTKRQVLHGRLRKLGLIRNRVAHLEPINSMSITNIGTECLDLIHLISPNLDDFFKNEFARIRTGVNSRY